MSGPRGSEDRKRKLLDLLTVGTAAPSTSTPNATQHAAAPLTTAAASASTQSGQEATGGFYGEAAVFERDSGDTATAAPVPIASQPAQRFLDDEDLEADVANEALLAVTLAVASFPKAARCAPFALLTILQVSVQRRPSLPLIATPCAAGAHPPPSKSRVQPCICRIAAPDLSCVQGLLPGRSGLDLDRELAQLESDGHVTVLRFANAAADAGVVLRADLDKVPPAATALVLTPIQV